MQKPEFWMNNSSQNYEQNEKQFQVLKNLPLAGLEYQSIETT